jgi:ABC-type nitrate/sulfonate/bicarbonate transport system substrate-binding protein/outer membrane protein OmpA-like peptidoglycan-associated protein
MTLRIVGLCLAGYLMLCVTTATRAADVTIAPLADTLKTKVNACPDTRPVPVPMITWGGDIPTIYANGNAARTTPDSLFGKLKLDLKLVRQDVFSRQVESYLTCESPYLRGTVGMLGLAADLTERDPRTRMQVIYQLTWSAGGDALVVKGNIKSPRDLKGKTIALQAYGPHTDYLATILRDAGVSLKDVTLRWTKDLTGSDQSPKALLAGADVDAALVILPDALALTSHGKVGSGAEESVKGARILLTTKTANRIITDVYAVRADYFAAHRAEVEQFVRGLLQAQEAVDAIVKNKAKAAEYRPLMAAAAGLLLDSPEAAADAEAMYGDAEFAGWAGNAQFFGKGGYPRRFSVIRQESGDALRTLGLASGKAAIADAQWNFDALKAGLKNTARASESKFDASSVAQVVARKTQQDQLSEGELFSFAVHFKPNQNTFSAADYGEAFARAVNLASTYGGAVITVEGNADPLAYVKSKNAGDSPLVLSRIKQAARNLSLTRAAAVRDSIVAYARAKGVALDPAQFAVVGHGIEKPLSGLCGSDPCAPKTEQEWLNNMRVEFRIIQVEAEANVFKP